MYIWACEWIYISETFLGSFVKPILGIDVSLIMDRLKCEGVDIQVNFSSNGATRREMESQDRNETREQKLDPMQFGQKGGVTFESSNECSTSELSSLSFSPLTPSNLDCSSMESSSAS